MKRAPEDHRQGLFIPIRAFGFSLALAGLAALAGHGERNGRCGGVALERDSRLRRSDRCWPAVPSTASAALSVGLGLALAMDVGALAALQPVDPDQAVILAAIGLAGGDRRRQLDRSGIGQFVRHRIRRSPPTMVWDLVAGDQSAALPMMISDSLRIISPPLVKRRRRS